MAGRDGRLHLVGARPPPAQRGIQQPHPLGDPAGVPAAAVLILEQHQVTGVIDAGVAAGVMQQHERAQAEYLGLVGHQVGQRAGQPDRLGAQPLPHQVSPRGRGVALAEQQVDHAEHAAEPLRQQVTGRHPVGNAGIADLLLGAHQALGHRRLGHQERPGNLGRGQPGDAAQRQRDPGLQRQRGMAAGEDQPQQVVGDAAVTGLVVPLAERRQLRHLPQFRGLDSRPPQPVEGPVAGRGGEPCAGAVRDAVARPALKRTGEGVLHALLGQVPVPRHPDQGRHDAARLLPEDGSDLGIGRHDQSSSNGLTSTAPNRAHGCRDAIWIASSRSAHSTMS